MCISNRTINFKTLWEETDISNTENNTEYQKRRKVVSIVSAVVLLALFAAATAMLWNPLINTIKNPEQFRAWVNLHGVMGRFLFIGMMALQIVFAVIPGEPMELGAGYAFGTLEGTVLCLAGAVVGSSIVFLFTKLLGIKMVEAFVNREKIRSMRFMKYSKNLNAIVFFAFLIPGTPKDILTYFIGLTSMKLKTFLILTSIARIPSVITSTITGNALGMQDYKNAAIVYSVTAAVSLIGAVVYHRISKPLLFLFTVLYWIQFHSHMPSWMPNPHPSA